MPIEPAIREWLARAELPPDSLGGDAAQRRSRIAQAFDRIMGELHGTPPDDDVRVKRVMVPTATGEIPARVFIPAGAILEPAYLFFFGGAWWQTTFDSPGTIAACRQSARAARVVVIQLGYSLAPEHPYPTALEQGYHALAWLASGRSGLPVDPQRIAVGGASAGANLAAALSLLARDRGGPAIELQVLETPPLDLSRARVDLSVLAEPGLDEDPGAFLPFLEEAVRFYLGDDDPASPYISPLNADSMAGLPPAVILSAEFDAIRPDGLAYAAALAEAGVPVVSVVYGGQVHDSGVLGPLSPSARAWRAQVDWALASLHGDIVLEGASR